MCHVEPRLPSASLGHDSAVPTSSRPSAYGLPGRRCFSLARVQLGVVVGHDPLNRDSNCPAAPSTGLLTTPLCVASPESHSLASNRHRLARVQLGVVVGHDPLNRDSNCPAAPSTGLLTTPLCVASPESHSLASNRHRLASAMTAPCRHQVGPLPMAYQAADVSRWPESSWAWCAQLDSNQRPAA